VIGAIDEGNYSMKMPVLSRKLKEIASMGDVEVEGSTNIDS